MRTPIAMAIPVSCIKWIWIRVDFYSFMFKERGNEYINETIRENSNNHSSIYLWAVHLIRIE
jgi:hypothetical protein